MNLGEFAATQKTAIFESLRAGQAPAGSYSAALLREAGLRQVPPQMGATRYTPSEITFEFIYPVPGEASIVLPVTIPSPERIVYLPVPAWVIQSIWQGEISGSYHFEAEAAALVSTFEGELQADRNAAHFGEDPGTGAGRS